jgi:DNA (cytosine-5)-methyltransferase 1
MTHGSLFSGIGGFDLAAEWAGWENKFHCEWNEFGKRVLNYYWPQAVSYGDITKTDFTIWRGRIDVLTGGFPCQPFSLAGKRKGTEDERHLWPEMLRAIREILPKYVVGENVPGLINWDGGLVFEQVQADLEAEGYEVIPFVLPAASVDAPHRRDRVWFVAYRTNTGVESLQCGREDRVCQLKTTPHSPSEQSKWVQPERREFSEQEQRQFRGGSSGMGNGTATNSDSKRQQECNNAGQSSKQSGQFDEAFSSPENWEQFPTQSPVCDGNDGLPTRLDGITFPKWRNESIKAGGNAIVPQVAYQIFKAINKYEET